MAIFRPINWFKELRGLTIFFFEKFGVLSCKICNLQILQTVIFYRMYKNIYREGLKKNYEKQTALLKINLIKPKFQVTVIIFNLLSNFS